MQQYLILVLLVCCTGVWAFPADNGHRVIITAPEYGNNPSVEKALFVPNNYHGDTNYYYGHQPEAAHETVHAPAHQHHHNKFSEDALRKVYDDFLNKKMATKKGIMTAILNKAIDKTVELKAKLTQQLIDFISRVSIETTANLAKHGIKATVHKFAEKKSPEYAYSKH